MLRKSQHLISNPSQNPKISVEKKLRFNEAVFSDSLHSMQDNGMPAETPTSLPRKADAEGAEGARAHSEKCVDRDYHMVCDAYEQEISHSMNKLQTTMNSLASDEEQRRHLEFVQKRKQFYQAEFAIAHQKSMVSEMLEPQPSSTVNFEFLC